MAAMGVGSLLSRPELKAAPLAAQWCFTSQRPQHAALRQQGLSIARSSRRQAVCVHAAAELKALVFDCDGVILESEDAHREAYNAAFQQFDIRCPEGGGDIVVWTPEYYDDLQNRVGGGKPKMRHYFGINGWPTSNIAPAAPETEDEQAALIDTLQDWKSAHFQQLIAGVVIHIGSGKVKPRPNVLRLMDEARDEGLKVAVCSAATKSSCIFVVEQMLGPDRYRGLDVFMAGDDVPKKKPDPSIYRIGAERLQLSPAECLVIEDSTIGLRAATGAGMRCMITCTSSTMREAFEGAERIFVDLPDDLTIAQLRDTPAEVQDMRQ